MRDTKKAIRTRDIREQVTCHTSNLSFPDLGRKQRLLNYGDTKARSLLSTQCLSVSVVSKLTSRKACEFSPHLFLTELKKSNCLFSVILTFVRHADIELLPLRGVSLLNVNIEWLRADSIARSKYQMWGTQNDIVSKE